MSTSPNIDQLIAAAVDGDIDAAGAATLAEFVRSDPQVARRLSAHLLIAEITAQELSPFRSGNAFSAGLALRRSNTGASSRFVGAVMAKARRRSQSRSRRAWLGVLAVAALVMMAIGVHWLWRDVAPVTSTAIAVLSSASDSVHVLRDGSSTEISIGMPLLPGDHIQVDASPANGFAEALYSDQTRVQLRPATELRLWNEAGAKRIGLERGTVMCEAARQPEGKPMVFVTAQAETTVVGTKLSLTADQSSTRLEISDGLVKFRRLDQSGWWEVGSGGYAMANPESTFTANARHSGPDETLRVIEDHEGSLSWKQSTDSAPLVFGLSPAGHSGEHGLNVVYEPAPSDSENYGTIIHPLTLKSGDHALRFFIKTERYEENASWNIQVRQRDGSCWSLGNGLFRDLSKDWNLVDVEISASPTNAYGGGTYQSTEVKDLLFSVCLHQAAFVVDDFAIIEDQRF